MTTLKFKRGNVPADNGPRFLRGDIPEGGKLVFIRPTTETAKSPGVQNVRMKPKALSGCRVLPTGWCSAHNQPHWACQKGRESPATRAKAVSPVKCDYEWDGTAKKWVRVCRGRS